MCEYICIFVCVYLCVYFCIDFCMYLYTSVCSVLKQFQSGNKTCFICYLYHNAVYMYILPIYGYIGRAYSSYCCTFLAVYAVRHYLLFIDMFSIVLGLGQGLDVQPLNRHRHILSNTLTHTQKYIQALTQTYTYTHTIIHTKTHSHGGSTVASLST